jgi:hypothetical protein
MRTIILATFLLIGGAGCSGAQTGDEAVETGDRGDGTTSGSGPSSTSVGPTGDQASHEPAVAQAPIVKTPPTVYPSGTNAYGMGSAGCSFGVVGAVDAWVDASNSWAWLWEGGGLQCQGSTGGIGHSFDIDLGQLTGPGVYTAGDGASYQRSWCAEKQSDCTSQEFAPPTGQPGCVVVLTQAPVGDTQGAEVQGTFSCTGLVESGAPHQSVDLYEGSFWATILPPPD